MPAKPIIDTCIHQWTVDLSEMSDLISEKWSGRLQTKSKIQDPIGGTLMPTLPWYHAYWNEDRPDKEIEADDVRTPERIDAHLADQNVETALLCGHEVQFLPALPSPEYSSSFASAYNELLEKRWLSYSDRLKGSVLVPVSDPEAAATEIEKYADDPDMVSALIYGGGELPLGHPYFESVYEAASNADMPITIHTSGNPIFRQTSMGSPEHYVTYDSNLVQNHMTNLVSLVFQGVLDRYPDLDIVWAGEGATWLLHTLWRSTRYYRNMNDTAPEIKKEPHTYLDQMYATTYACEEIEESALTSLYDMVGTENILYGSGYPRWNADTPDVIPDLPDEKEADVFRNNAAEVYNL